MENSRREIAAGTKGRRLEEGKTENGRGERVVKGRVRRVGPKGNYVEKKGVVRKSLGEEVSDLVILFLPVLSYFIDLMHRNKRQNSYPFENHSTRSQREFKWCTWQ